MITKSIKYNSGVFVINFIEYVDESAEACLKACVVFFVCSLTVCFVVQIRHGLLSVARGQIVFHMRHERVEQAIQNGQILARGVLKLHVHFAIDI